MTKKTCKLPHATGPECLIPAYHGTTKKFKYFEGKFGDLTHVPDRAIGPHFAVDPKIATTFITDWATGEPKVGGHVKTVCLRIRNPRVLNQKPRPGSALKQEMDQPAFQADIGRVVFPRRKDLFVDYWSRERFMSKEEVSKIYDKIAAGKGSDHERLSTTIDDPSFAGIVKNYGLLMHSGTEMKEFIVEYRKALREEGYDGIQYQNTAPMETKEADDTTTYIPLSVTQIKPGWRCSK